MKEFKYIIWHQGNTSSSDSTMLFVDRNNEKIELSEGEKRLVFDFISVSTKTYNGNRHEWKKKNVANLDTRLKVYADNWGNILISSHFEEYDEDGRRVVFIFCTKKMNWDEIATMLSLASKEVGKTVQASDLAIIRRMKNRSLFKPVLAISITLVIIYIIWKIFLK